MTTQQASRQNWLGAAYVATGGFLVWAALLVWMTFDQSVGVGIIAF